jgi:hypothetical protein
MKAAMAARSSSWHHNARRCDSTGAARARNRLVAPAVRRLTDDDDLDHPAVPERRGGARRTRRLGGIRHKIAEVIVAASTIPRHHTLVAERARIIWPRLHRRR